MVYWYGSTLGPEIKLQLLVNQYELHTVLVQ